MTDHRKMDAESLEMAISKARRQARRIATTVKRTDQSVLWMLLLVGLPVIINWLYNSKVTPIEIGNVAIIAAVAISIVGAALSYLSPRGASIARQQAELEEQILKRRMVKRSLEVFDEVVSKQILTDENKEKLLKRLENSMTADAVIAYHESIIADTQTRARESVIPRHFSRMYERLSDEADAQARRGNCRGLICLDTSIGGKFTI